MTQATRAPGWHPDPEDPSFLRHWDGARWGGERRPRPSWAGGDPATPGDPGAAPGRGPLGRRRWRRLAIVAAVVAAVVALAGAAIDDGPALPPPTLGDRAFAASANAACARQLAPLRRERPQLGDKPDDPAKEVAAKVERTADRLERLAGELRRLPVAAADRAEVTRWLDDWTAFVAVGRDYATALVRGEERAPAAAAERADPISRRVYVYAQANGMPECVF